MVHAMFKNFFGRSIMKLKHWIIEVLKTFLGVNDYCPNCRGSFSKNGEGFIVIRHFKNDEGEVEKEGIGICLHCLNNDLIDNVKIGESLRRMHVDDEVIKKSIRAINRWRFGEIKFEVLRDVQN